MIDDVLFTSKRLQYRPVTSADAQALFDMDNDPEVMRWINGGEPLVFADFCRDQMPTYLQRWPQEVFGFLIMMADEKFVGWVSLRPTGQPFEASLGYRLIKDQWGRGYATEAASALINRAFSEVAPQTLHSIVANTYEENMASQKVLEKVGMTLKRRERPELEDLAGADTAINSDEVWEGDEFYYAIARSVTDYPAQ